MIRTTKQGRRLTGGMLSAVLVLLALMLVSHRALAQARIPIFSAERLASAQNWTVSDATYFPSTPGHNATVSFPVNKWSALIGTLPLKGLDGAFTIHVRCRWTSDLTVTKGASCALLFIDADHRDMPEATVSSPIPVVTGWQDVTVKAKAPKGAATVRFDISCGAGGAIEIADYDLYLEDVDLSRAAARGVHLPWLNVSGGNTLLLAAPDSAGAAFAAVSPYAFDAAVWTKLPQYPIPTTRANKTPLNDVAARFQMAWTADTLYIRYHAHDPILNFKAKSRYERDCFEFFLAPAGHLRETDAANAGDLLGKEQYTVTRTIAGQTDSNADAITRLVSDGWEAILKIPLQTEARRIYPFNGLTLTFNAVYQDSNTLPQEHWLSFSARDQTNSSWQDAGLYVPLVFQTEATIAYKPFWRSGDDVAYNVAPKYPGRINLVHSSATLANVDLWDKTPEARLAAYKEGGHDCFRVVYPNLARQRRMIFVLSPFNVLAGETLEITMDSRADAGPPVGAPNVDFLSESSWNLTGSARTTAGTLSPTWTRQSHTMVIPDTARGSVRNGRLMLTFQTAPGRTVEVRDIRVKRRVPADFDALISVPNHYSHFWQGEPSRLDFQFANGSLTPATITAEVQNYLTGKIVLTRTWKQNLPAGQSASSWDVSALPNGFFNVRLKVVDAQGGFLAHRELYVSKSVRNTRTNPFSGVFLANNYDVVAPQSIPDTVAMLQGIGEGRAQWSDFYLFDSAGNDLPGDPLALLRALHQAGFETGFTVPQSGTHDIGRNWQPDELQSFYDRFLTKTKGLFSHLSFSNEPNLYGGWSPEPDAREWAIYSRGFYDSVKRLTPGTKPILGSFNTVPLDFIKTAATENDQNFAHGVVGLHLYGLDPNKGGFADLMASRRQLDQIHPGWEAWDTESGIVFYTFEGALDLQSKKMPILLTTGYTSSIYLDGANFVYPCGDSTPLIPMEAFKNKFYLDSAPVGHVTLNDGKVDVYLFKRSGGQGIAAFWNTSHDAATIDLPVQGWGRTLDLFGNPTGDLTPSKNHVELNDRFVRYAEGVDLAALTKDPTFVAAFRSTRSQAATNPEHTTQVYLSLPVATKAFDREVTVGETSTVALSLHNTGSAPASLRLGSDSPTGLRVTFDKGEAVLLKPQETRIVVARFVASKDIARQPCVISGTLTNGRKISPIVFSVQTTPPVGVHGYTRAVEIANHTNAPEEYGVVPTKPEFVFQPGVLKGTLAPHQSVVDALQIAPNGSYNGNFASLNIPVYYSLNVTSSHGAYTTNGKGIVFAPSSEGNASPDFASLPYTAVPERPGGEPFQADYNLCWAPGGLRIQARVHDSSPAQNGENGFLREGGDCLIVALDPGNTSPQGKPGASESAATEAVFGAHYRECGFAYSHHAPTAYVWDGHYGPETSQPFPGTINKIDRDSQYIYYDVTIPQKMLFPDTGDKSAGMSLVFVNRGAGNTVQKIELGQGILPQRDAAKMGLLIDKR